MFLLVLLLGSLGPPQLLLLDAVLLVYLCQQEWVHLGGGELSRKVLAPVDQGQRRLALQCCAAGDPLDLVRLQEAEAKSLSD